MSARITREGKNSLILENPVMNAAGILGFGDAYRDLIDLDALGAFVTNPVTIAPWTAASGTRVIPLDAGALVHTGLPNPGLRTLLDDMRSVWTRMTPLIIVHLVVNSADEARRARERLESEDRVDGVELGLNDEITVADASRIMRPLIEGDKPLLVRLPFGASPDFAAAIEDAGADGLVLYAPPRGTARDGAGRLVPGRIYAPLVKPLTLRGVGQIARRVALPITGAGGIHHPQDARDYLEAGAVAIQFDTVAWILPSMVDTIARDLGGLTVTQPAGALPDEWFMGMTDSEQARRASIAPTRPRTDDPPDNPSTA